MTLDTARLMRIAARLALVDTGSVEADIAIHSALRRTGPVLSYTTDEGVARSLLPLEFTWLPPVFAAGAIFVSCRRAGMLSGLPHPHIGQWGLTLPLAFSGAAIRAYTSDGTGRPG